MQQKMHVAIGVATILVGCAQLPDSSETGDIRIDFQVEVQNLNFVRHAFRREPPQQTQVTCPFTDGITVFGAVPHRLIGENAASKDNFVDFLVHYPTIGDPLVLLDTDLDHVIECVEELPTLAHPSKPGTLFRTVTIDWKGDGGPDREQRYRIYVPDRLSDENDSYSLDLVDVPVARWSHEGVDSTWILFDGNHNGVFDRQFGDGLLLDTSGKGAIDVRPYVGDFVSYHAVLGLPWGEFEISELDSRGRYAKLRAVTNVRPTRTLNIGDTVPALSCQTKDGEPVRIGSGVGKHQLVFFWLSNCGSCAADLRAIVPRVSEFGPSRLSTVGVSMDETDENVSTFAESTGADWPHCFSGRVLWDNELARRLGAQRPSDYVIIDPSGTLLYRGNGFKGLSGDLDSLTLYSASDLITSEATAN